MFKILKITQRGVRSPDRKGCFESLKKIYTGRHRENGEFLTQNVLVWVGGTWLFFSTPRPSFPDLEILTFVQGGRIRKRKASLAFFTGWGCCFGDNKEGDLTRSKHFFSEGAACNFEEYGGVSTP